MFNLGGRTTTSYGSYVIHLGRRRTDMHGGGWIVEVLPQLEQQSLYDRFKPFDRN